MPLSSSEQEQEREWLRLAQHERDPQAFARLVAAHQGQVRSVLRQLTQGQMALADDLAQETFLKAWYALPSFRHDAQWSTWLYRIAYREFLQFRRRQSDSMASSLQGESGPTIVEAAAEHGHDLRLDLTRAMAQLHPLETAAIVHCYYAGLSHTQAAEVLGLPVGTVKSHIARGRAKLQTLLAAWKTTEAT